MQFKNIIATRRSIRKYNDQPVPQDKVERILQAALGAPSARNSRSTHLLVVDDPQIVARMAAMRDTGAGFMVGAPMAIVVLGDTSKSDLWQVNASIAATFAQLAAVDEGLATCWVHVAGRPRVKAEPDGEKAADYLRTLVPIPEGLEPLCVLTLGCSDFHPAPLPESNDNERVIRMHNS